LIVRLERIPEEARLPEGELEAMTADLLPSIYGALLDLLVIALRNLPSIKPARLPRMADFARLCLAAGIPGFAEAYASNIETGCQAAVEANPLAAGILSLLEAHNGYWQGTTTELIRRLQELDPTNRDFQGLSARSVGKKLASSLRGDLAAVGVEVDQGRTGSQRYLILSRVEPQKTTPLPPLATSPNLDKPLNNSSVGEQSLPTVAQNASPARNNGATAESITSSTPPVTEKASAVATINSKDHDTGSASRGLYALEDAKPECPTQSGSKQATNQLEIPGLFQTEIVHLGGHKGIPPWIWDGL
jgi:hypothetical protein